LLNSGPKRTNRCRSTFIRKFAKESKIEGVNDRPLFYMVGSLRGEDDERILKGIENKVRENNLQVTNNLFHRKM
jgi:hypothetical protein